MKFLDKMERKLGRYAIRNLMMYVIVLYAAGSVILLVAPELLLWVCFDANKILHGQVWRLVTFLMMPMETNVFLLVLLCYVYYMLGTTLERTWGAFRFNLYFFLGMLGTILSGFIVYWTSGISLTGLSLSATYINLSLFFAYALTYPDANFYLAFLFPIKAKWLALVDAAMYIYLFIQNDWVGRASILASLLNVLVFFLLTRNYRRIAPKEIKRRRDFRQNVKAAAEGAKHKCAVCGRTEQDDPNLVFRYCSRCEGNYEYCQDHLYTHKHVTSHPQNQD